MSTEKKPSKQNYHKKRVCPVDNCFQVRVNMPEHLVKVHKLSKGPLYYNLLKKAVPFDADAMPTEMITSPRKTIINMIGTSNILPIQTSGHHLCEKTAENDIDNTVDAPLDRTAVTSQTSNAMKIDLVPGNLLAEDVLIPSLDEIIEQNEVENDNISTEDLGVNNEDIDISRSCRLRPKRKIIVDDDSDVSSEFDYSDHDEAFDPPLEVGCVGKDVETLIQRFCSYMVGPDRNRKERSVTLIASDVRRIFSVVGVKDNLEIIFRDGGSDFRDKYIVEDCGNRNIKATSIKKYLYSLLDFCEFLVAENIKITNVSSHDINTLIGRIKQWRKNYKNQEKLAKHVKAAEDLEMLVDSEQVKRYQDSENVKTALALFDKIENYPNHVVTRTEYCSLRDHIYTAIHFSCAPRSGVTANMTMKEFELAKEQSDGRWLIEVWDHKTVQHYGPAKLLLSQKHFRLLKIFVNNVRTQTNPRFENVFLSWSGNRLVSGDVSKRLHLSWEKAGNFSNRQIPKNLSANIVRKSTSTGLREKNSQFLKEAAVCMAHSTRTAEDHYFVQNMRESAIIGTKAVSELFNDEDNVERCKEFLLKTPTKPVKPNTNLFITPVQKKVWLEEDVQILKDTFDITKPIDYNEVKSKSITLKDLNASPRQIYDKARSLCRRRVVNSPHKRKCLFSEEDIINLRKYGAKLIEGGLLTRNRFNEFLLSSGLIKKYSFSQLRTRLQYERRIKK